MPGDTDEGDFGHWARDPDLSAAGARYRAELRAEAAVYEQLAAKDRLRGRTLGDVAAEAVARGDIIAVAVTGRSFTGQLSYAAGDLACLRTSAGETVEVHLSGAVALRVVEEVREGGHGRTPGPGTFAARLGEHEAAGTLLEIGARVPDGGLVGRIEAVGVDHVVVTGVDGARWFVARSAIDYVLPRRR
ncbi:MAG TPA: hypothetical protein VM324_15945 [Egibacteraceae bacterium]|jgi:hypothetical protein|nr:hypothetical protein [Egibacteraceae bacterium]